jgi:hypothetical protein
MIPEQSKNLDNAACLRPDWSAFTEGHRHIDEFIRRPAGGYHNGLGLLAH